MSRPAPSASSTAPPPGRVDLAIVGGGIMGLGLAYQLARRGFTDVVVLEAHHLAWGASGRNGGGVRAQWSTELHVRLMQESLQMCRDFARELGVNVWMRQGGYLFLARSAAQLARLERSVALQVRLGLRTRLMSPAEAGALVPELALEGILGGCFNPDDAIVFPWPFLWGYAAAAQARGVAIHTGTPVTAVHPTGDGFDLETPRGRVRARRVVNAAGAWSRQLAALAGVTLPTWPVRHEILSTEPLRPFLRPMVSLLDSGLYFSQSLRGEIVGGITLPEPRRDAAHAADESEPDVLSSTLRFATAMARALTALVPRLGAVRVVRQWAGPYDHSPDGNPIVGEAPGLPGFFLCCGFVGHGFMMAPVVARYYAGWLLGDAPHPMFNPFRPDRFAGGPGAAARDGEDLNIG